jgi:His-Xaa-Ser system protein HxsD
MEPKNSLSFNVKQSLYPLDVVYAVCYSYFDKVYVYLDQKEKNSVDVTMIAKVGTSSVDLEKIKGEFHNDLIFSALRHDISKKNKRIRESIVFAALFSAQGNDTDSLLGVGDNSEEETDLKWQDDPLGIAIPWEEKKRKSRKIKKKNSLNKKK